MDPEQHILEKQMQERFAQLPKVVQQAITSADVQKHLRELADAHKLHLDQWTALENEVMLALLGLEPIGSLAANIEKEARVDSATAQSLAQDISQIVFAPIRKQLEIELQHPDTVAAHDTTESAPAPTRPLESAPQTATITNPVTQSPPTTHTEAAPAVAATSPASPEATVEAKPTILAPQTVVPATPPTATVAGKAERASISSNYTASQASHERKTIEGDPYREQIA